MGLRSWYTDWRRRAIYRRAMGAAARTIVLRYHAVGSPDEVARYVDPGLSITPERFREHVRLISRNFDIVLPTELETDAGPRPGRPRAVLTFDDGYRDNHDIAWVILREEGVRAAFYITTAPLRPGAWLWISELWRLVPRLPSGPLDLAVPGAPAIVPDDTAEARRRYRRAVTSLVSRLPAAERDTVFERLAAAAGVARGEGLAESFVTPDQLRAMHASGMAIGAHTETHPHLDRLPQSEHDAELRSSRVTLETILGVPVDTLAYPNPGGGGPVGEVARAGAARAGFRLAFTSIPDPLRPGFDPLRWPRLGVYSGDQERTLFAVLAETP